ncbi:DUF1360 domain-containing protein [Nocardia testacea]|uniref:DUF1360 domain-containing protein n=1 Tax=Nocardia testacea TaxID=248551 RepID=UPI003C2B09E8
MTVLVVTVLYLLAVVRLTRLVVFDKIVEPFRALLVRRLRQGSRITYVVHCPWCVSVWLAAAAAPPAILAAGLSWWTTPLLVFASSHVAGLLAEATLSEVEGL